MGDTLEYLTHASISVDRVVEWSDIVGAAFGQIEGLLGDEPNLHDLQQSSEVGQIDIQINSENGHPFGQVTIVSNLDKAKTAILVALLRTLTRVGPYQAITEVTNIEDAYEVKCRIVVERVKELLAESSDDTMMSSTEVFEAVKESVRVEDITEYQDLPVSPYVANSDAIIVAEERADMFILLRYGTKNAVAVEGTNVPDTTAGLTQERTVIASLSGNRGGELVPRELSRVDGADYVAFAPDGRSVEDLNRTSTARVLRSRVASSSLPDNGDGDLWAAVAAANGMRVGEAPADPHTELSTAKTSPTPPADGPTNGSADTVTDPTAEGGNDGTVAAERPADAVSRNPATDGDAAGTKVFIESEVDAATETVNPTDERPSLTDHIQAVTADESGTAYLLNDGLDIDDEVTIEKVYDTVRYADPALAIIVVDGGASQKLVDIAAQRDVGHVVARLAGEYVRKFVNVYVRIADQSLD